MSQSKTITVPNAIKQIESGSSVAMGLALEHAIPFAAGHEMVRQQKNDLTLIGPISDILFDQLIGGDVVESLRVAWVGNVSTGSGYRFRQAIESGTIEIEDHSNFSMALALEAGSMGVPYLPTRTLLGTDILEDSDQFVVQTDPFEEKRVVLVPAIHPDWCIVHVQRADERGNAHLWGNSGTAHSAVGASDHVILTAEKIVSSETIKSDSSRTQITEVDVDFVVECPYGAHPSPLSGFYNRAHEFYVSYAEESQDREGFDQWANKCIYGVDDRAEYVDLLTEVPDLSSPTKAAEVTYGQ